MLIIPCLYDSFLRALGKQIPAIRVLRSKRVGRRPVAKAIVRLLSLVDVDPASARQLTDLRSAPETRVRTGP